MPAPGFPPTIMLHVIGALGQSYAQGAHGFGSALAHGSWCARFVESKLTFDAVTPIHEFLDTLREVVI